MTEKTQKGALVWNCFYQNIIQYCTVQYVRTFAQNTYWKHNNIDSTFGRQSTLEQKELTSKKGATKQTSKQPSVNSSFVIAVKMSPSEPTAKAITSVIGKMMILEYQP